MNYITHKKFHEKALCGEIEIPEGSICKKHNNLIIYNNKAICFASSEFGHTYFARNDDNQGMLRGKLTSSIKEILINQDENYQKRWNRIWQDELCQKYKRPEHPDHWLWNDDFFNAPIEDLKYIINLIEMKEIQE